MQHFYESIHGWFNFREVYEDIVNSLPEDQPSVVVEVGCWRGRSTAFLGTEIINSGKPISVFVVDTFEGSKEHESAFCTLKLRDEFDDNITPVRRRMPGRFFVRHMPSVEAAGTFPDESLAAVWLDASHEYEDVRADITAWLPKIQCGGFIGGDDWRWISVQRAVEELLSPGVTVHGEYPWWVWRKP